MLHHHLRQQHKLSFLVGCVFVVGVLLLWYLLALDQTEQPVVLPEVSPQPRALVMPHHDLILEKFPNFYETLTKEERTKIKKIILLSPNHLQPERMQIVQRGTDVVLYDQTKIKVSPLLHPTNGVVTDNQVFLKEHGVNIHLRFITKYFPEAELTTLLFTRNVTQRSLDEVVKTLNVEPNKPSTLIIASVDFSHYLSYSEAKQKDTQTLNVIYEGQAQEILQLNDDYLDCPACMYVLMSMMKSSAKTTPDLVFHGNSAQFLRLDPAAPTTSYFVLKW